MTFPTGEVVHPTMMIRRTLNMGARNMEPRHSWPHCLAPFLIALTVCAGGTAVLAQTPPMSSEDGPGQSQHGYFDFESVPTLPSDGPGAADSHLNVSPFADTSLPLDAEPKNPFLSITMAEGFEQDLEFRRSHLISPVRPTKVFRTDTLAVHVVFRVHKHYAAYQVMGQLYPEDVAGLDSEQLIDEDAMYLALEDESGYLKLFPPEGGWKPGRYRVEIYIGYEVNPLNRIGTMRFTMKPVS